MNLHAQWIVGFIDGEGCFTVSIVENKTMNLGYQVIPEFVVVQHIRNIKLLYTLKSFFGCGLVKKNHDNQYNFCVKNYRHLNDIIIPFFEKHHLKTMKRIDFEKFRYVVRTMTEGQHLTPDGLKNLQKFVKKWELDKKNDVLMCKNDSDINQK